MNTKTHRALALFAATALTASSLVACAPQASTSKDSQKAEAGATSQSSETGSPKQTEEKPSENTSPTANSTTNSTTSSAQTEQTGATSANTTSGTTSPEAAPSQASITGWLIAVCLDASSATSPAVTSVALSNNILTVEGTMAFSESEPQSIPDDRNAWVSGPITFTVDEHTRWQGRGGEAGTVSIDPDQLIQVVNSHNGLGLIIQVENDVVSSITLAS